MMKGTQEPAVAMGVVIFTIVFLTATAAIGGNYVSTTVSIENVKENIHVADLTHMIESCFSQYDLISESFLEEKNGDDIFDVCQLPNAYVRVKDFDEDKEWFFGTDKDDWEDEDFDYKQEYSIFVSIFTKDNKIHMGELDVKI